MCGTKVKRHQHRKMVTLRPTKVGVEKRKTKWRLRGYQTGPDQVRPDQTGPKRTKPDRTGSDRTGPDQTGPGPDQIR